ncbi:MAG: ABC transporter substrate-binding protein [Spirochaetales bacterium]|nr:ABC transporter substrate-binding protein [Spirochaetales bacterium]
MHGQIRGLGAESPVRAGRSTARTRHTDRKKVHAGIPLLAALAVLAFTACAPGAEKTGAESAAPAAVELTDSFGRTIRLKNYPERIVSLAPNMTETLFLLGAGNLIVGRTDYCDYPLEAAKIPPVGSITTPSIEHIVSLAPDLIVGSTHFQKETLAALENLRIPVYLSIVRNDDAGDAGDSNNYEEIFDTIIMLAKLVNKTEEAEKIVSVMRQRKDAVEQTVRKAAHKPRVYYMISFGEAGDYTAGRGTYISALIKSAGGLNTGDDIEGWKYSAEALFRSQPDIILCGTSSGGPGAGNLEKLRSTAPYNRLRAVQEGRVYGIDNNLLDRTGPRNIDGLEMMAKIFHPDLFPLEPSQAEFFPSELSPSELSPSEFSP